MRNILYICSKNQYDWDSVVPHKGSTEMDISVLLLQDGVNLRAIPFTQVSILNPDEAGINDENAHLTISYQDFLEKIFLMDLAVMI
jgi:hypothetical protein